MANKFVARKGLVSLANSEITGSLSVSENLTIAGTITGTVTGTATSASYVSLENVDGFIAVSESIEDRISAQELFSSSLDDTFATEAEVLSISSSLSSSLAVDISGSDARLDVLEGKTLVSESIQIASDISGSLGDNADLIRSLTAVSITGSSTALSESLGGRIASQESFSSSLDVTELVLSGSFSGSFVGDGSQLSGVTSYTNSDTLAYINSINVLSGSANAATATSASYASNASTADSALAATSASHAGAAPYSGLYGTVPTWNQNTTGNADTATSSSYASNASTADSATAASTATSSSYASNASTADSALAATSASHASAAPYSGLYGTIPTWNQNTTGNAATATSASYASNASTADSATAASTAISASFATNADTLDGYQVTALAILADNNNFGGIQTFESINVNGTASFGYVQAVTGSATIIADQYVVVNAATDGARFAGLQVYDSESNLQHTASLAWDSLNNKWIYANASGSTYSGGGLISGPRNTGSLGEETYPTLNYVVRGQGGDHIYNSNILDNDTAIKLQINTEVTGSLIVSSGITGTLTGNASTATSASYATYAASAGSATTATSASYASNASTADSATAASTATSASYSTYAASAGTAGSATTATSSSYASNASTADSAATATSASYASAAPYSGLHGTIPTWNQNTTGNSATATSASYATFAASAGSATSSTSATSASYAATGPFLSSYTETDTLATVTARGASTSTNITLSGGGNLFNGHHYFSPYDSNGNHYPHYNVGASNNGSKLNLRMFAGDGSTVRLFYLNGNDGGISWDGNTIWHAGNLTNLNQLTNGPGYITGYTETDTLASVTGRGASTSTNLTFNGTLTMGTGGTQYIRMGRFPASVTNTGEAWIGRASDRSAGTMTVQLGTGTDRIFEVVDYAWSTVIFNAGMSSFSYKGNTIWHAGNDGASSGLDADLWDGNQFSSYLNQAVLTSSSPTFAGLSTTGNTNLGDGNGDTTRINDILYLGASDSGDAHFYFGEDSSSWYGSYWYWDSSYTHYWYSRSAGTNTLLMYHDTRETTNVYFQRHILPTANNTYNLGSATLGWANIYTNDLHLSNMNKEEGNDIDGTRGDWTIQEGEEHLYIINNRNGKKFKIKLEEVE